MKHNLSTTPVRRHIQAHREIAASPEVAAALEKLFALANKDRLDHTNLLQYHL